MVERANGFSVTAKGPGTSGVAVKGPRTPAGSRHESQQVPPQPYAKEKMRS
jgi:hypothetical protein